MDLKLLVAAIITLSLTRCRSGVHSDNTQGTLTGQRNKSSLTQNGEVQHLPNLDFLGDL